MNRFRNDRLSSIVIAILALAATLAPLTAFQARAQAVVFHDQFEVPVDEIVYSDCAGEDIHFTGSFHVASHTTVDANGIAHVHITANDHNVSGVGLSSGTKYRRVGATNQTYKFDGSLPLNVSVTNSFNFIGQGANNNFLLISSFHFTINANGEMTGFVDNFRLECR
jgi:hypothetical protein